MFAYVLYIFVGLLFAFLQPFESLYKTVQVSGNVQQVINPDFFFVTFFAFIFGVFVATIVRFVPPKTAHVITFLNTWPIQSITTGIKVTLPWPLGYPHRAVSTEVRNLPLRVDVLSLDKIPYPLPASAQWYVSDAVLFAIERQNPEQQIENLLTSAIRSAAHKYDLLDMYDNKDEVRIAAEEHAGKELASFGVTVKELLVQDPHLPESIAQKLSAIRESQMDADAAVFEAEATFTRGMGVARTQLASMTLNGYALQSFRLSMAEGYAGAIAVAQGKCGIKWVEHTIGEKDEAVTVRRALFVKPEDALVEGEMLVPENNITPEHFAQIYVSSDSNDALRDAAAQSGTTIVVGTGANVLGAGLSAAVLDKV